MDATNAKEWRKKKLYLKLKLLILHKNDRVTNKTSYVVYKEVFKNL